MAWNCVSWWIAERIGICMKYDEFLVEVSMVGSKSGADVRISFSMNKNGCGFDVV